MSVEEAKKFIEKIKNDKEFASAFKAATVDARKKVAVDAGYNFTENDLKEALTALKGRELSEEELASVAGGSFGEDLGTALGEMAAGL